MGFFSSILGGVLGYAIFGPIGAILGAVLGSSLFSSKGRISAGQGGGGGRGQGQGRSSQKGPRATETDFKISLLILMASIMRCDGRVTKGELAQVKAFLRENFTEEQGKEMLHYLKVLLDQSYDYRPVCGQIAENLSYSGRMSLLHWLFKIAVADSLTPAEERMLQDMAARMGISQVDYTSIRAAYIAYSGNYQEYYEKKQAYEEHQQQSKKAPAGMNLQLAYQILEISSSATDTEVKKAYRKMAMKYHPDKVNTLGEAAKAAATERFKAVNEAYEYIKLSRNIK